MNLLKTEAYPGNPCRGMAAELARSAGLRPGCGEVFKQAFALASRAVFAEAGLRG